MAAYGTVAIRRGMRKGLRSERDTERCDGRRRHKKHGAYAEPTGSTHAPLHGDSVLPQRVSETYINAQRYMTSLPASPAFHRLSSRRPATDPALADSP